MREIKFRAWDKKNKIMVCSDDGNQGYGWFTGNDGCMLCVRIEEERDIKLNNIMQYTGLQDQNGKEIYEGDIVKYQFDNDDCPFPNKRTDKIIGRVFFSEFRASFSVTAGRNGSKMLNDDLYKYVQNGNRVEVIGNIYENPELLEVG